MIRSYSPLRGWVVIGRHLQYTTIGYRYKEGNAGE